MDVPVAEVALEGEQVLVEALDGLLLQDVVDPVPSVQRPDLHRRLLLPRRLRAFGDFMLWNGQNRTADAVDGRRERRAAARLTLLRVLLLLFDLIGHDGQLGLQRRRGVGPGELVERLPGVPQGAHEALLQVRAHPGQTLLQLWNRTRLR